MLKGFNNPSASTDIYTLKIFVVYFNFYLFTDHDKVNFPSQLLQSQNFLTRTVSPSFLEFFSPLFLKYFSHVFI